MSDLELFCSYCKTPLGGGAVCCPRCGAPAGPSSSPDFPYIVMPDPAPLPGSIYRPVSTAGFIGMTAVTLIPLINIVLLMIWACGGAKRVGVRNYARAMLVVILAVTIAAVVAAVLLYPTSLCRRLF